MRTYGSVRGAISDGRPYRDQNFLSMIACSPDVFTRLSRVFWIVRGSRAIRTERLIPDADDPDTVREDSAKTPRRKTPIAEPHYISEKDS
jgi:hypothetical protein